MTDDKKKPKAKHLTDANFQSTIDKAKEDDMPVFIDFYADWCGPCKVAGPIVDKLAGEYRGKVLIAKLNVDENPKITQEYGAMSIPTVVILKGGKEVDRKVGFPGEEGYVKMIEAVV